MNRNYKSFYLFTSILFKFVRSLFLIILFLTFTTLLYANDDESNKNEDEKNENNKEKEKIIEEESFGNRFYSRHNFYIKTELEMGVVGTSDFITENVFFQYRLVSKNKHAFSVRVNHIGFTSGALSNNPHIFSFAIFGGFEYMFKIFSNTSGLFLYFDLGGSNKGIAFNTGVGLGSRLADAIELNFSYLHDNLITSRLDFQFLIVKYLILKGRFGISYKYTYPNDELFIFLGGLYIGFSIKGYFRLEAGGGFTLNEYSYASGFGGVSIVTSFP